MKFEACCSRHRNDRTLDGKPNRWTLMFSKVLASPSFNICTATTITPATITATAAARHHHTTHHHTTHYHYHSNGSSKTPSHHPPSHQQQQQQQDTITPPTTKTTTATTSKAPQQCATECKSLEGTLSGSTNAARTQRARRGLCVTRGSLNRGCSFCVANPMNFIFSAPTSRSSSVSIICAQHLVSQSNQVHLQQVRLQSGAFRPAAALYRWHQHLLSLEQFNRNCCVFSNQLASILRKCEHLVPRWGNSISVACV